MDLLDQAVVLGVEDRVHRRQADVLVDASVAGDVVLVEQLVVVEARARSVADDGIGIGRQSTRRVGAVRDVDQELVARADGIGQADRRCWIAFHQDIVGGSADAVGVPS